MLCLISSNCPLMNERLPLQLLLSLLDPLRLPPSSSAFSPPLLPAFPGQIMRQLPEHGRNVQAV